MIILWQPVYHKHKMNLNEITYGNPTQNHLKEIRKPCMVDGLFSELKSLTFPENDSELVVNELNVVTEAIDVIGQPENHDYFKMYRAYDKNLIQTLSGIFAQKGIDVSDLLSEILNDVESLIVKLKYHFQRPRPYQLAQYYKIKLFPYNSTSSLSPSFPSGHTTQGMVMLEVIGNKFPQEYQFCQNLLEDICNSRVYLGLHYESDNEGGKKVATAILKHPEFVKKYSI